MTVIVIVTLHSSLSFKRSFQNTKQNSIPFSLVMQIYCFEKYVFIESPSRIYITYYPQCGFDTQQHLKRCIFINSTVDPSPGNIFLFSLAPKLTKLRRTEQRSNFKTYNISAQSISYRINKGRVEDFVSICIGYSAVGVYFILERIIPSLWGFLLGFKNRITTFKSHILLILVLREIYSFQV